MTVGAMKAPFVSIAQGSEGGSWNPVEVELFFAVWAGKP